MTVGILRAVCIWACTGALLACGGGVISNATDAASDATFDATDAESDATSDASDASHDAAPEAAPYDPTCPEGEGGSPSSWTAGPGDPCTVEYAQCFSYAVVNGTWMECCGGTWHPFGGGNGFPCPK